MEQQTEKMRKMAAITALSANYDQVMQKDLMKIWLDLLEEYSASEVVLGVKAVMREYEYKTRPPFAVLKKAIDKTSGKKLIEPEEALKMMAHAEWDKLLNDISAYGRYKEPKLDPTTAYVIRGMGGWNAACEWKTDRLEWRRREFLEKWEMAYGNEECMALGALGVKKLAGGQQSAAEVLQAMYKRPELAEGAAIEKTDK